MRLPDWELRLFRLWRELEDEPHQWGRNDCAIFADRCVEACTGKRFGADLVGRYRTPRGAIMKLRGLGVKNVQELAASHLVQTPISLAQRGDIVAMSGEEGVYLACMAGDVAVSPGPRGLVYAPAADAVAAYKVT